ncbi:MAG: phage antirepressor KilAC domain-containing protein [Treponema sp.]|nr:phage antirepressor KilAC domain-containing protein [Treponema sp.]
MNELQTQKTVTTKELADALSVDVSTVTKTVQRINATSDVLPKFTQGQTPRYTEKQATIIKMEIQKSRNLQSRQIDFVSTEYEENLTIANALTILQRRNDALKARVEKAELAVIEQKPKVEWYDNVAESSNLTEIGTVGKMTGIGAEKFFKVLSDAKIIYAKCDSDGIRYYVPYFDYERYFKSVPTPFLCKDKRLVRNKLMFTQSGVIWATKRFKAVEA